MDHDTAVKTLAAERYVLRDMDLTEASAYEAHYFECRTCARELQDTEDFVENARAAFREMERGRGFARLTRVGLPYAAAVLLGGLALYQVASVNPRLRQSEAPGVVAEAFLDAPRTGRSLPEIRIEPGSRTFHLWFELIAAQGGDPRDFPALQLVFRDESGATIATIDAATPELPRLLVRLPTTRFVEGRYTMAMNGVPDAATGSPVQLHEYGFQVIIIGNP